MKNLIKLFPLILCIFMFVGINQTSAQRDRNDSTDEYFDESGASFKQRLWFGGGIVLNYQGRSFNRSSGNEFIFGLSPMVGYKLNDFVSFGPRIEFNYISGRYTGQNINGVAKFDAVSFGIGPFARLKPIPELFAHVEYQYSNTAGVLIDGNGNLVLDDENRVVTGRINRDNFFIGAGYSSSAGSLFGYEISILYNLLEPDDSQNVPITIRGGFTYNF